MSIGEPLESVCVCDKSPLGSGMPLLSSEGAGEARSTSMGERAPIWPLMVMHMSERAPWSGTARSGVRWYHFSVS